MFVAPPGGNDPQAPLVVTWHMLDAPRTDAAFAAAEEFLAALAALRDQLPVGDEPVSLVGGSLGGAVALDVLTVNEWFVRQLTAK